MGECGIMKIGLLTFQNTTNYGALLQAFALYKTLAQKGANIEVIDYRCENIEKREMPLKYVPIRSIKWPIELLSNYMKRKKYKRMEAFKHKYIKLSDDVYTRENIKRSLSIYDKFISGSDMIWELNVTGEDYTYYLDFVDDPSKKYSFSSSFGYDTVPRKYDRRTQELLSK